MGSPTVAVYGGKRLSRKQIAAHVENNAVWQSGGSYLGRKDGGASGDNKWRAGARINNENNSGASMA